MTETLPDGDSAREWRGHRPTEDARSVLGTHSPGDGERVALDLSFGVPEAVEVIEVRASVGENGDSIEFAEVYEDAEAWAD